MPYYNAFSFNIISKFIISFITANIFNYIDRGTFKFPLMIYKNMYMKDNYAKIKSDKQYIAQILKDRNWNKLVDIYTLNRFIRLYFTDNTSGTYMIEKIEQILKIVIFNINRLMICWTILGLTQNIYISLAANLLFIYKEQEKFRYFVNVLFFMLTSIFCREHILILIFCNIGLLLTKSSLIDDIIRDTNHITNKIYTFVRKNITSDIFIISIILALLKISNISMSFNLIMLFNTFLVLMTIILKSETYLKYVLLFVFGYISNMLILHMIGLPFVIQYISVYMSKYFKIFS